MNKQYKDGYYLEGKPVTVKQILKKAKSLDKDFKTLPDETKSLFLAKVILRRFGYIIV